MKQVGGIQKTLLLLSTVLIGAVGYLSLNPAATSQADSLKGNSAQLISELAKMESRLQQQIEQLRSDDTQVQMSVGEDVARREFETLSRKLALLLERQQSYEQRFAQIESRLNQMSSGATLDVATTREISVLNATPVTFNTQHNKPRRDTGHQDSYQAQNQVIAIQQQMETYDRKLFEEEPDSEWSNTIQTRVIKVINENAQLAGVHLQDSQCGKSLCKLEVYVEEGESVEEKVQMLMVNRPWQGESFVSFEYNGQGAIFFARNGEQLP